MEYIFYLLPHISTHDTSKKCYSIETYDDSHFQSTLDEEFEAKKLCLKCAFHAQLWYNELILEKRNISYRIKAQHSKYAFSTLDLNDVTTSTHHPTMILISHDKAKRALQELETKHAYKASDIEAYDTSKEILSWICHMYQTYHVHIFYEEYL